MPTGDFRALAEHPLSTANGGFLVVHTHISFVATGCPRFNHASICGVGPSTTHNTHIDYIKCPDKRMDHSPLVAGVVHFQKSHLEVSMATVGEMGCVLRVVSRV